MIPILLPTNINICETTKGRQEKEVKNENCYTFQIYMAMANLAPSSSMALPEKKKQLKREQDPRDNTVDLDGGNNLLWPTKV